MHSDKEWILHGLKPVVSNLLHNLVICVVHQCTFWWLLHRHGLPIRQNSHPPKSYHPIKTLPVLETPYGLSCLFRLSIYGLTRQYYRLPATVAINAHGHLGCLSFLSTNDSSCTHRRAALLNDRLFYLVVPVYDTWVPIPNGIVVCALYVRLSNIWP